MTRPARHNARVRTRPGPSRRSPYTRDPRRLWHDALDVDEVAASVAFGDERHIRAEVDQALDDLAVALGMLQETTRARRMRVLEEGFQRWMHDRGDDGQCCA